MKYHNQADGKRILISDMTDEHLKNTITLFLGKVKANQNVLRLGGRFNAAKPLLYAGTVD